MSKRERLLRTSSAITAWKLPEQLTNRQSRRWDCTKSSGNSVTPRSVEPLLHLSCKAISKLVGRSAVLPLQFGAGGGPRPSKTFLSIAGKQDSLDRYAQKALRKSRHGRFQFSE